MFTPGYYKTNYRALRLREMVRWYGFSKGLSAYLITRFKQADSGVWMPELWIDTECRREDLSEEFRLATKPHQLAFEQLGFTPCGFLKLTRHLNPLVRDTGGIHYLDSTRRHFGQLHFVRIYRPASGEETNVITFFFTAAFEVENLTCTNQVQSFDAPPGDKVIRLTAHDAHVVHQKFLEQLRQRKDSPRQFPDDESLRQWSDAKQIKACEARVRRRLFVRMTDKEVTAAKARLESGDYKSQPPRRISKLAVVLWVAVFIAILLLHHPSRRHPHFNLRSNVLEYQGQQFKMKRTYSSYEDFKDDPDNLDTHELDRIEQTMLSVKIQPTYKDRKEFIYALFDLKFPGYGMGGIGEAAGTDDGSTIEVESVEIPHRDKDRYIVSRESGGRIIVLDDFVSDSSSNKVRHVKLEKQTLRYYGSDNHLIREKQL